MVDITAKLFWYRSKEWYQIMADKLTDFVYTDESKETIDVINLLLLGWILLGLIVYIVGNIVASYLRKRQSTIPVPKHETADEILKTKEHVSSESEVKSNLEDILRDQEIPKKSYEIPVCEGDDQEVAEWINNVFSWIYKQRVISPVIDAWISALNARTRLSSTEHGILVDFKDLHAVNPPRITEVRQSSNYKSDINLGAEMEVEDLSFEVVVTQFKEKDKIIVPFNLNVQRMIGRVVIECTPEDLTFVVKYSETPQIQLSSELSKDHEMSPEDCQPLSDLVNEITVEALSSVIVPLRFNCFPACPRLLLKTHSEDDVFEAAEEETEKQLLVKIIKASKLGGSKGCSKPYCVVEMDEPPQKFETKVADGTDSPFWDESFKFIVKDSAELLFEIYDKDKPSTDNFLGLGIVGMDELEKNPSQRQIIPLQSRPLEEDDVTGSLTAEFVFLNQSTPVVETTHLAQHITKENGYSNSGKTVETNSRVTAGGTVITTTTIKRTKEDAETDVPGTALKELEKHSTPTATSKSTLIIHSVQRPENSVSESLEASPASHASKDSHTSYSESAPTSPSLGKANGDRSRPKEKKTLMGTLRRRLSFHKNRSKSAENRFESASSYSQASSRSTSADRGRQPSAQKLSPFKGKFLGQFLTVPGSTRSSLSEASGISASSTRTYINENSTLVIETNENGIIKRYLIPNSLVHRSKWKKRGTKLHIFNDHVFLAKHLSGSTTCQVCQKQLTRRPGKQGYECRGCNLQCHKSCHVKVESYCSNSTINSMEVEYIHDPKGASPKSI
ncbi:uncharacterized protein LOC129990825 isoform X3 [Argiope bruennichi]|uniref:uncharacterized protein LOC129990825 isoform X3 n=1 Tax=Argiope bruennichi TaxID=94029 RepID=UPI00249571C2|nr:uncharacterized protein LOC129990825 isoform X3 [Argiope bruennichi]